MNQPKLLNKKIIISAAADGIGWAIAQACMLNGAFVYITDINNESLNKISKHHLYEKQLFLDRVDANNSKELETLRTEGAMSEEVSDILDKSISQFKDGFIA